MKKTLDSQNKLQYNSKAVLKSGGPTLTVMLTGLTLYGNPAVLVKWKNGTVVQYGVFAEVCLRKV